MYYTIFGHVDTFDDSSYERDVKENGKTVTKTVQQFTLNLIVPGQAEMTKVSIPGPLAPSPADMDKWEDASPWIKVQADALRLMKGETDGRGWAMVSFNATSIGVATAQEQADLNKARKALKAKKTTERQQKAAEKKKAKVAA